MNTKQQESDGATRVAYILGVAPAANVVRQWPQMGETVRTSKLFPDVEGNFPELTLEVGRRLQLDDVVGVEWTCEPLKDPDHAGAASHGGCRVKPASRRCRG